VLASLRKLNHPRLVRLVGTDPLKIGSRTALLLDSAGDSTLAQVLRERPRLSLDLLERYGRDLLDAVVALDKANVDQRDIKPAVARHSKSRRARRSRCRRRSRRTGRPDR
jgi:hypothetical protein